VSIEWQDLTEADRDMKERLLIMAKEIVPYHMAHNAEAEGCDLLMEIERLDLLQDYVDDTAYTRVCLYLTRLI
jgi:26S proteasome regulatory subunit N1